MARTSPLWNLKPLASTEMQSMSENDFERFASIGVKSPLNAMFSLAR